MLCLNVSDVRPFIPSEDFDASKRFYTALGFDLERLDPYLSEGQQIQGRNQRMAEMILSQGENYKQPFIGIGILHFKGESSLQNILTKMGYRVTRIF